MLVLFQPNEAEQLIDATSRHLQQLGEKVIKEVRDFEVGMVTESKSSASVSVRSHLMAFAAEASRLDGGRSIDLQAYYDELAGTAVQLNRLEQQC